MEPIKVAHSRQELQELLGDTAGHPSGDSHTFENLVCEFCEQKLRPFPTLEQQRTTASSELYCCEQYKKFVEYVLETSDSFEQELRQRTAGSSEGEKEEEKSKGESRPHHKSHKIKTRERNVDEEKKQRADMEKQMAMLEKAKKMRENQARDSKNVKTINFQLSKYRCYEEGMVVLPADFHLSEMEQFQHKRIQAAMAEQASLLAKRQIQEMEAFDPHDSSTKSLLDGGIPVVKNYEDGKTTFLTLLADGTSSVYYPSGNLAITVSLFNGIRTFTAFSDAREGKSRILAIFMSSGFGTVYTADGTIRLTMTPAGGFEANPSDSTKRRRWAWSELLTGSHVHAPPFQCIFYHINSYLSVRVADITDWTITFFYKQFRCRFNVMAMSAFDIVESNAFDMSDIRLVRLAKFQSQFSDSSAKLK